MVKAIEMGTVSSRGQIAIPSKIRKILGLKEGSQVFFIADDTGVLVQKLDERSFSEITEPLRKAKKKIKEEDVPALVKKIRQQWKD